MTAVAISLIFGAVIVVLWSGAHDVIGDRAYAKTPEGVALLGRAAQRQMDMDCLGPEGYAEMETP